MFLRATWSSRGGARPRQGTPPSHFSNSDLGNGGPTQKCATTVLVAMIHTFQLYTWLAHTTTGRCAEKKVAKCRRPLATAVRPATAAFGAAAATAPPSTTQGPSPRPTPRPCLSYMYKGAASDAGVGGALGGCPRTGVPGAGLAVGVPAEGRAAVLKIYMFKPHAAPCPPCRHRVLHCGEI